MLELYHITQCVEFMPHEDNTPCSESRINRKSGNGAIRRERGARLGTWRSEVHGQSVFYLVGIMVGTTVVTSYAIGSLFIPLGELQLSTRKMRRQYSCNGKLVRRILVGVLRGFYRIRDQHIRIYFKVVIQLSKSLSTVL